jgi:predicted nucleotidyltransferase/predicted transcriptional regulator with HTH domain
MQIDVLNLKSNLRRKLLTLFFTNPDKKFYIRQLERLIGYSAGNISVELKRLSKGHLFNTEEIGNALFYQLNKNHPIYPELKSIIYKTEAIGEIISGNLHGVGDIKAALIFGSIAKGKEKDRSDIDILIIGNPDTNKLYKIISGIESALRRKVNFVTYSLTDWKQKVADKDSFAMNILNNDKIPLIDDINVI